MNIVIPRLKEVKLTGFDPIFSKTVEFDINDQLYIILGGNGLGKTTILQAIIFGIAGPADDNIEPQFKDRRWNRSYFRDRLDHPANASIEVSFFLAKAIITIKRNVSSDKIMELFIDGVLITDDKQLSDQRFEEYLQEQCGYGNIEDFNFVVHKLCYLSEKRENLAWDMEAQTRILMQILANPNAENWFRKRRITIKEIDSAIRHKTVNINALQKRIQKSTDKKTTNESNTLENVILDTNEKSFGQSRLDTLQKNILDLNGKLTNKRREFYDLKFKHTNAVVEIDKLRDDLSKFEHAFFFEQLNKLESNEAKLSVYKLLHYKLCPACGNQSEDLYNRAVNFIKEDRCPICGTEQVLESGSLKPGTEAELSEKIKLKIDFEKEIISIENDINNFEESLRVYNQEINEHILTRRSSVVYIEKAADANEVESTPLEKLKAAYNALITDRNELQIQFDGLEQELNKEYEDFNITNNNRIEQLFVYYEKYATEFLTIPCTLSPIDSSDRFLNLKLFVPVFNDRIRRTPESCSEAQRFFLDIAFRMALVDLINELSGYNGTFICETPENALDITYINNVADMFQLFSWTNKNILLLTSNIQVEGIAQNILIKVKEKKKRASYFLNLLEIGNLSQVQKSDYGQELLKREIDKILKAK